MIGIPPHIHKRLLAVLLKCGPFSSDSELEAVFVDARLSPWRYELPQADKSGRRARATVAFLSDRYNLAQENALVLLLRVLSESISPHDVCHQELTTLAEELERYFHSQGPGTETGERDPSSAAIIVSKEDMVIEELLRAKAEIERQLGRFQRSCSIMFTDVKGSTAYFSAKGDMAGRLMVQKHNDMLFPVIEKNEGRIIKTVGDAIMAAFDDAASALGSAIEMQKRLARYNHSESTPEEEIHIRIGINTGVGIVDPHDVFGNLVNIAARVEALADADQIYITQAVYDAIDEELEQHCRPLGKRELKGIPEAQAIYEVLWQAAQG